jgi:hypothetical protein
VKVDSGFGASPYFTPQASPFGAGSSPLSNILWEQNPDVAYYSWGRSLGIPDDNSGFSRWFASQLPKFGLGYGAYTAQNPITANIVDYANSLGGFGDWQNQFLAQDPRIRGEDPSSRGGGPARWVGR